MQINQPQNEIPKHLMKEMEEAKPSSDPKFWAKKGCRHCHGRGTIGTIESVFGNNNKIRKEELCSCARKNWARWRDEWLEKRKNGGAAPQMMECHAPSDEEKLMRVLPRMDSLEVQISDLKSEIAQWEEKVSSLPHHAQIQELEAREKLDTDTYEEFLSQIEGMEKEIDRLNSGADALEEWARNKRKQAAQLLQTVKRDRGETLKEMERKNLEHQAELRAVQKSLHVASHRFRHKVSVAQRKMERLEGRKVRITQEVGIDPKIIMDSCKLSQPAAG